MTLTIAFSIEHKAIADKLKYIFTADKFKNPNFATRKDYTRHHFNQCRVKEQSIEKYLTGNDEENNKGISTNIVIDKIFLQAYSYLCRLHNVSAKHHEKPKVICLTFQNILKSSKTGSKFRRFQSKYHEINEESGYSSDNSNIKDIKQVFNINIGCIRNKKNYN